MIHRIYIKQKYKLINIFHIFLLVIERLPRPHLQYLLYILSCKHLRETCFCGQWVWKYYYYVSIRLCPKNSCCWSQMKEYFLRILSLKTAQNSLLYVCLGQNAHMHKRRVHFAQTSYPFIFFTLPSLVHHICCRYYQAQSTKLSFFNIYRAESSQ